MTGLDLFLPVVQGFQSCHLHRIGVRSATEDAHEGFESGSSLLRPWFKSRHSHRIGAGNATEDAHEGFESGSSLLRPWFKSRHSHRIGAGNATEDAHEGFESGSSLLRPWFKSLPSHGPRPTGLDTEATPPRYGVQPRAGHAGRRSTERSSLATFLTHEEWQ